MRITEIRLYLKPGPLLKAVASITLEDCFVVHGVKVVAGRDGHLFVAMPTRMRRDRVFQDVAHPITPAFRKLLEETVIGEYHRVLQGRARGHPAETP